MLAALGRFGEADEALARELRSLEPRSDAAAEHYRQMGRALRESLQAHV